MLRLECVRHFVGRRKAAFREPLKQGALARATAAAGRCQLSCPSLAQAPEDRGPVVRRLAQAQGRGECRRDDFAERVVVVIGCEVQQIERRGVEHRFVIEQREGGFELYGGNRRCFGDADQHADQLPPTERHAHPDSELGSPAGGIDGRQIVEYPAQRGIERNLQDQGDPFFHKSCG